MELGRRRAVLCDGERTHEERGNDRQTIVPSCSKRQWALDWIG